MKNTDISKTDGAHLNDNPQNTEPNIGQSASSNTGRSSNIRLSSLQDLKAVFLSMDWEINDDILNKLINESEKLMNSSEDDLVLVAHFKMLAAIGKYIKKNKAGADKDAVGLLGSVFESMERVIGTVEMSENERKQLVLDQIAKFQALKQKVTGVKAKPAKKKKMDRVMDEAIKSLQSQLDSLREEVAQLRDQINQAIAD